MQMIGLAVSLRLPSPPADEEEASDSQAGKYYQKPNDGQDDYQDEIVWLSSASAARAVSGDGGCIGWY